MRTLETEIASLKERLHQSEQHLAEARTNHKQQLDRHTEELNTIQAAFREELSKALAAERQLADQRLQSFQEEVKVAAEEQKAKEEENLKKIIAQYEHSQRRVSKSTIWSPKDV